MTVKMLQSCLSRMGSDLSSAPQILMLLDQGECWRAFQFPDLPRPVFWNAADFRTFVESPRPAGCGTPIAVLRQAVEGTEAKDVFEELVRGERGGSNNPYGRTGKPEEEINRDNITVDSSNATPLDPAPSSKHRDYSREAPTGTSVSYAVRRLGKERPDLLEKVKTRELSAHAAMVEAGFKQRQITIPVEPEGAARRLKLHFRGEEPQGRTPH